MHNPSFSSKLLEAAINEFARLPGIGRKTALRLVMHMLKQDKESVNSFGNAIIKLRNEIRFCDHCHNISETALCPICSDPSRDQSAICIVENIKDIISIENTHQYHGLYHVLGGIISPMEGIGPAELKIESLEKRVGEGHVKELILALSTTMEGDTTNFYISRKMARFQVKLTTIARGISVGDELEYTDELTLGRSIVNRIPFETK